MSHTARVGLFMLVALIILGVFIIKIEEIPLGARGGRESVEAIFPSVAGLDEKSPVRIAGVRVGIVERIQLKGSRALVTLAIDRDVKLHEGARAEVSSLGLLGDKYVELFPGDPGAPLLKRGTILQGTSPIGFDQALKSFNDAFANIDAVTASLRQSMAGPEGEKRIQDILENVRTLTASIRDLVQSNRTNVDATLANMRTFSESLKTELPRFADKLVTLADDIDSLVKENRGNVDASLANVKDLTAQLRVSADNLNRITGKIASGQGSVGKLVNDETTVNNLNSALKSVEGGANALKNTIGRPEGWHLNVNVRAEALPGVKSPMTGNTTTDSRSALGIDLHTTARRFYRLELVNSPVGRTTTTTDTITTTGPGSTPQMVTQTVVQTKNNDTVNAQIGYLVGSGYTLRAGLFESTGGVGIDKDLFRNQLRLTFEAYELSRETKPPHLRFEGRWYLTRNIFAYAGWDDPVWKQRSSVLFGGGVTWQDEDLKYLLGTVGSAVPK
jgi:phospholipid/cholesterol/gamma-HCH transport system substrate-binding protein